MKFQEQDIPTQALQEMGLYDGKNNLLPSNIKEQLLRGEVTEFVNLKNIPLNGEMINIDAKLSLQNKNDGSVGLYIHPIYSKSQPHILLDNEENIKFQQDGVHKKQISAYGTLIDHGRAKYQFDDNSQQSYFVKLLKTDGKEVDIWGVDLERALKESGHNIGDKVQLDFKGRQRVMVDIPQHDESGKITGFSKEEKERNTWQIEDFRESKKKDKVLLFEYDSETKSFIGVDQSSVMKLEEINGVRLTPEQKREFAEGKRVSFSDGTEVQLSPASPNNIKSNRNLLIASLLLDAGITFAMFHVIDKLISSRKPDDDKLYNKGYLDALNKVKADLLRKQDQYPNDPKISQDLSTIGKEIEKAEVSKLPERDLSKQHVDNIKVNDPELDDKAFKREKDQDVKLNDPNFKKMEEDNKIEREGRNGMKR